MKHIAYTLLLISILFFSCEKIRTPKIYGTWELIKFTKDTSSVKYTYMFTKIGKLYSFENDQKIDSCEYIFYVEKLKSYFVFSHDRIKYLEYPGKWQAVELKKKRMVLVTAETPGMITREFIKVD